MVREKKLCEQEPEVQWKVRVWKKSNEKPKEEEVGVFVGISGSETGSDAGEWELCVRGTTCVGVSVEIDDLMYD